MKEQLLPRGCTEISPPIGGRITRLANWLSSKWNEAFLGDADSKERLARDTFNQIVRASLSGAIPFEGLSEGLSAVDPKSKLTYQSMLARVFQTNQEGRIVVTTTDRISFAARGRERFFALGGIFELDNTSGHELLGRRQIRGQFLAVVFNSQEITKLRRSREIKSEQLGQTVNVLLSVYREYLLLEQTGEIEDFLKQNEFDQALNWLHFRT